ncbi:hypothetical protein SF123566_10202 [Shigella flexneri 1235-66]|nr:hypothetical protein SF123566_10202 [Shigella flexneri 1235-66]
MVCSGIGFFMITPQHEENKKYRFIASLCKNDMGCLFEDRQCPPLTCATLKFFTPL